MKKILLQLLFIVCIFSAFAQSPTIQVSGSNIVGVCGDNIILRGVNYAPFNWGNDQTYAVENFSDIAKTGTNCVRIVWYSSSNYTNKNAPDYNYISYLDTAIARCIRNKMIPIIELHDVSCDSSMSDIAALSNWYLTTAAKAIISKYAHNLIIDIANEAGSVYWAPNPNGALAYFKSEYDKIVSNLRSAGINVPLMIDAPDCGESLLQLASVGSAMETADPKHNLIFSAHAYWYGYENTNNDSASMRAVVVSALNQGIPIAFGEVANLQDGSVNCQYIDNYKAFLGICQQLNLGWLAWCWDNDVCSARQISNDGTYSNLTTYGNDIVNNTYYGLKKHSVLTTYLLNNQACSNAALSGNLTYDNSQNTPIDSTEIELKTTDGNIVQQTTTDAAGKYVFNNIKDGSYFVIPYVSKALGGVDPIDALLVNRTYIGLYSLTDPIKKLAADVNIDNKINPIDALLINRRYIKLISSFTAGDWLFQKDTVKVAGSDVIYNFKSICTGDVNGSYVPAK